jgi:hypothetical protein
VGIGQLVRERRSSRDPLLPLAVAPSAGTKRQVDAAGRSTAARRPPIVSIGAKILQGPL